MTTSRWTIQSLFFALLFAVSTSFAYDWPPIAPEDLAMTNFAEQPGAPAIILIHEENADDLNNFHSVYMRIKVLTEAGRKYADVEIPYSRRGFSIGGISGRTVHADGSIVPFEGKPFDKVLVKGRNLRYQVKSFTLPDVQVGSIIEYRYDLRYSDHSALAPTWLVQSELFQKKESYKFTPYGGDLILPHNRVGRGVAWTSYLPTGSQAQLHQIPTPSLASSHTASEWVDLQMNNVGAFTEEPFMPPAAILKFRVNFYYRSANNQQDYWKDEGKFWNKDVESFIGRKKGVEEAVAKLTGPADPPDQKLRKLYAFVAKLENLSYRPAREQQEQAALGWKPAEGVEDVLRQNGGFHDELNRLLVAMARTAGFPAWMIRVPARDEMFFDQNYLSTDQFDGEVAIVQVDGKDVFLDPGTKFCPYGLIDWRYSSSKGMRQSATKGTEFADTPPAIYTQALTQRVARVKLTDQGTYDGTVAVGFFGLEAMNRRRSGGKTDAEGRKKELEEEMKKWLPGGSEVSLTNTPQWEETEKPLVAEFKVNGPLALSAGKRWLLNVHLFQVNSTPVFAAAKRTNPIYFDFPFREIDEVHITLPATADVESLPEDGEIRLEYAIYRTQQKKESANTIFSRRDMAINGMAFPAKMYDEIKGFYDKVKTGDDQQALLKAVSHAAGN